MKKLLLLLLATSCSGPPLQVEVKYISRENLASYYVNTPDPRLYYPKVGQELMIRWNIPEPMWSEDLQLVVTLNMRDYTTREEAFTLKRASGHRVISVANEDYFKTGGILSFRAEVQQEGQPIYVRKHQLYVDLIRIGEGEPADLVIAEPECPCKVGPFVDEYILPDFGGHGKPDEPPTSF